MFRPSVSDGLTSVSCLFIFRRARLTASNQLVEDIDCYNRSHRMMSCAQCQKEHGTTKTHKVLVLDLMMTQHSALQTPQQEKLEQRMPQDYARLSVKNGCRFQSRCFVYSISSSIFLQKTCRLALELELFQYLLVVLLHLVLKGDSQERKLAANQYPLVGLLRPGRNAIEPVCQNHAVSSTRRLCWQRAAQH